MEISEIVQEDLSGADALRVARKAVQILDARKGKHIQLLHVEDYTPIAEYYVLCTGNSRTQVQALTNELVDRLGGMSVNCLRKECSPDGLWNLVDFGPVIIHVFNREGRDFYHLEKLFGAGAEVDITSLLTED